MDEESEVQFNNSATRILEHMDDWEEEEGEISGVEDLNETSPEEEKEFSVPRKEVNGEDQLNKFQELLSSGRCRYGHGTHNCHRANGAGQDHDRDDKDKYHRSDDRRKFNHFERKDKRK